MVLKKSLSSLFILLTLLVAPFSRAGVRESKDWIVDSRAHKFLTALADNLGTEDTVLAKGHAVGTLSLSGCNFTVLVVGPVEGDAQAYARTIDAWRERQGFTGDVEWSQEDDCAAAKYSVHPGHVGMKSATTTVDLPALRAALLALEPHAQFAVSDAVWSKVDFGFPPDATSAQGTRYWNLTTPRPGLRPVSGTIALPSWMPSLALGWLLLPIVGVLACFGVGVLIAKNERLPLPRRRRLYGKAVMGGTYGVLGLHSVLVVATLPTRVFDPLAQLWFGTRFTSFALPIVPAFIFVPLLALPLMNRVEKRLLAPSDEERLRQEPEPVVKRSITPVRIKEFLAFRLVFFVVGVGLMGIGLLLPKTAHYRSLFNPLGILIAVALPSLLDLRKGDRPKFVVEPETLDHLEESLRKCVGKMAGRLDMVPPASRVLTEAIYGRFGAIIDSKGVGVTVGALEGLTSEEVDFLVAHELAHEKLGHLKRRRIMMFAPMALALIPIAVVLLGGHAVLSTPALVLTPMLIPVAFMVPYSVWTRHVLRKQEFEADRLAVQATGNPKAAGSALRKVTLNSASPGLHDMDMSSHPAVSARLAALGV